MNDVSTPGACPAGMNVSSTERKASAILGGVLALIGIRQFPLVGVVLLLAGGAMAFRASTGYCPLYDGLGIDTTKPKL